MVPNKDDVTFIVFIHQLPSKVSIKLALKVEHEC